MKNGTMISGATKREQRQEIDALNAKHRDEIQELNRKIKELEAEKNKYKDLYYGHLKCSPRPSHKTSPSPRPAPNSDVPSYLRETKSSKYRNISFKPDEHVTPPPKRVAKKGPKHQVRSVEVPAPASADIADSWDWHDPLLVANVAASYDVNQTFDAQSSMNSVREPCTCVICTRYGAAVAYEKTAGELKNNVCQRTRLEDSAFWETPESRVYIPFKATFRLMNEGLRLARDALWHALRVYWPGFQKLYYPHGPGQVRFSYKETGEVFNYGGGQLAQVNNMCGMPPSTINNAIRNMHRLRNSIAHANYPSPAEVDAYLEDAQELACALCDESRASKIRGIRDRNQKLTQEAHQDILDFEPLAYLPGTRHWALHHQTLFRKIALGLHGELSLWDSDYGERVEFLYHPAVIRAAVAWNARFDKIGSNAGIPPFILPKETAAVAKKTANVSFAGEGEYEDGLDWRMMI